MEKIYGEVEPNFKFEIGAYPKDFRSTQYYGELKEIYEGLQTRRGFKEFVKAKTLPNCDFFVPNPGFIVEFDESQHFTLPRKIALERYPEKLELGFDRVRWMALSKRIDAKDNDPPHRDEQRAWYDTLRDFLPTIKGLKPTVRLFARDFMWCSLDPNNPLDVKRFENFLTVKIARWEVEVEKNANPFLARVIIAGEWNGNPEEARGLLEDICEKWPKGRKVKFVITCGGFIQFDWPESISRRDIGDSRYPNNRVVQALAKEAKKCVKSVLSDGLDEKLGQFTNYITLGIDSHKEKVSTTQNYISQPHVELVFLIDLGNNKFYQTGKSYPTPGQEGKLVRISDLKTHFFDLDDVGKVMILGCHDLKMFDPRVYKRANMKTWRKNIIDEFHKVARREKPTLVFQHPDTTDCIKGIKITNGKYSPGTWDRAWEHIKNIIPTVEKFASAGKYYNSDNPGKERSKLVDVLGKTKCGNTIDFIVRMNKER